MACIIYQTNKKPESNMFTVLNLTEIRKQKNQNQGGLILAGSTL